MYEARITIREGTEVIFQKDIEKLEYSKGILNIKYRDEITSMEELEKLGSRIYSLGDIIIKDIEFEVKGKEFEVS